ncbi:DNA-3-methyladenine glycosylase [Geotalea sp. SG265]|uniref:DNA-3-methyladenine glycosylase n=1 Tax=Geotalea sp. SG265 TaxID=2922867 RepID=UPI001FAEEE83|nr:DNA-3-methyladenine glycosylase [Geotalea sp. SG265]
MGLHIRPLKREELPSETQAMARFLIGRTLVVEQGGVRLSGRIVETEAYPPGDAAGRAFSGKSAANESLYLDYGHAFVYLIYGLYHMLNVVSEPAGIGAAVLLRSLEPLEGIRLMEERRGTDRLRDLARGPGRLAAALGIDRRYDGIDLFSDKSLWLGRETGPVGEITVSTRIGITREAYRLWRYYEAGNPFVSGPRSSGLHPRYRE